MNRKDIIRMAREAGLVLCGDGLFDAKPEELERFANLVAAAEREACARVCDELDRRWINQADRCAERIRQRSDQ